MNSNPNSLKTISSALEFANRIRGLASDALLIARDLVEALDINPRLADELAEEGINPELIRRLERFGRGQIHPSLVFDGSKAAQKLITLPLSEQTIVIEQGIEVLDDDEKTIFNRTHKELDLQQLNQVIRHGRRIQPAEQRTLIRKRKSKLAPVEGRVDFQVHRGFIQTNRPGKWPKALILQWLSEMG